MYNQSRTITVFLFSMLLAIATFLISGCVATLEPTRGDIKKQPRLAEEVYLSSNIHGEVKNGFLLASYANWTDPKYHRIIPVNTIVDIHKWDGGFAVLPLENGDLPVIFEYNASRMQMSIEEYIGKITSIKKRDLSNLSEIDQEGIENGEALIGMSKEGVRIALGFPARHETPSLEKDTWVYWDNRWDSYNVIFDREGKVTAIQD